MTTASKASRATKSHRRTVELEIADIVQFLRDALGTKLTAYIAGVKDPKMVSKWANGDHAPSDAREKTLRAAFQIFQMVLEEEDAYVARAWFIGMNPQLGDDSPADYLRDGRHRDVAAAARAFLTGG